MSRASYDELLGVKNHDGYGRTEDSLPFLSELEPPKSRWRLYISQCWPWILSTVILAITSMVLFADGLRRSLHDFGSYETGFRTDLGQSTNPFLVKAYRLLP